MGLEVLAAGFSGNVDMFVVWLLLLQALLCTWFRQTVNTSFLKYLSDSWWDIILIDCRFSCVCQINKDCMNPAVLIFLRESSIMCNWELLNLYQDTVKKHKCVVPVTQNGSVWTIAGHSSEGYSIKSMKSLETTILNTWLLKKFFSRKYLTQIDVKAVKTGTHGTCML